MDSLYPSTKMTLNCVPSYCLEGSFADFLLTTIIFVKAGVEFYLFSQGDIGVLAFAEEHSLS